MVTSGSQWLPVVLNDYVTTTEAQKKQNPEVQKTLYTKGAVPSGSQWSLLAVRLTNPTWIPLVTYITHDLCNRPLSVAQPAHHWWRLILTLVHVIILKHARYQYLHLAAAG